LSYRLESLVQGSSDPLVCAYVLTNLGAGVPVTSRYYATLQGLKDLARRRLLQLAWDPLGLRRALTDPRLAKLPQKARLILSLQIKRLQEQLEAQQRLQWHTTAGELTDRLATSAREQAQLKELLRERAKASAREYLRLTEELRQLAEEGTDAIALKLHDEQPLVRWLAVQVAGRQRLPLEGYLIDLLSDPAPLVRDAARQALIRLSRGNDFGPPRNATAAQVAEAVRAWRQWYDLQDWPAVRIEAAEAVGGTLTPPMK
jgi:hypothetical protein